MPRLPIEVTLQVEGSGYLGRPKNKT